MAADNHAHYARIGTTIVLGAIAIIATLIYIAGIGDNSHEYLVETYYDYPVSGLSKGSPVNFRGVQIGEVREVTFIGCRYEHFDPVADAQRVSIVMALTGNGSQRASADTGELVQRFKALGLRATVSSSGITGLSRIEFNIPDHPVPLPTLAWTPQYDLIPPQPSLIESFSESVTKALNQFNDMDFHAVWSNMQITAESAAAIAIDARRMLESGESGIDATVRNLAGATAALQELAEKLKQNPSMLLRPNDPDPLPETSR